MRRFAISSLAGHRVAGSNLRTASAILALLAAGVPAAAQQAPQTPLAAVSSETVVYPDGGQAQEEYNLPDTELPVQAATPEVAGLAAAMQGQASLGEGFSILPAETRTIGPSGAPAEAAAAAAPSPEAKFITVHPLAYQGVPLAKTSDYVTIISGDNKLLLTRKRGLPSSVDGSTPDVSAEAAVAAAMADAGASLAGAKPEALSPSLQIYVDDELAGHLTWTFTLDNGSLEQPDVRRYWVAAIGDPQVLHWESEIFNLQHGLVSANLWATSAIAGAPIENLGVPDLRVTRSPGGNTVVTGTDGRYGYTTNIGNAQITAVLQGPFAVIQNQAGANLQQAQSGGTVNPVDINFAGGGGESDLAQTSAFYWVNFAHVLAQPALGPASLASLLVRTNINSACNAYWNGSSLNFFHAGNGCPNTAYSDVAMHEFGHGVDAVNGGIVDGGYSEGFGDSLAVLATQQPCVGRDFFGAGTCLRPATDVVLWPLPAGSDVHLVGRPYAGFVWQLVQELRKTYSDEESFQIATRLVLGAAAANPANVPDAVRLSFVVDAPDGNPAHGSPHFTELAAAADSRHIPRPANPLVAGGSRSSSATFSWAPAKTVSQNSVILQATIHLDQPSAVHIVANTSARSSSALAFATGVYNTSNPNVVWTASYRNVQVAPNQWDNFSTTSAINLPAGDTTIYWKIWVHGGTLTLSAGTLLVEAFASAGSTFTLASLSEPTTAADDAMAAAKLPEIEAKLDKDKLGQSITTVSGR